MDLYTDRTITLCPSCGQINDAHTNMTGAEAPKPGDATVCVSCVSVLVFDQQMNLKFPTDEQREKIEGNAMVRYLVETLLAAHGRGEL